MKAAQIVALVATRREMTLEWAMGFSMALDLVARDPETVAALAYQLADEGNAAAAALGLEEPMHEAQDELIDEIKDELAAITPK